MLRGHSRDDQRLVHDWYERRSYEAVDYPAARVRAAKGATSVSVIVPARSVAETIGPTVQTLVGLARRGVIDEVVVVDAASLDRTADIAARAGARVLQQDDLAPELGPAQGKGDALWRALGAVDADVVCFVDADSRAFQESFALGLLGPLLEDDDLQMVRGAFDRPFLRDGRLESSEGGRVTELAARPLLNLLYPELSGFVQPLAGEFSMRRALAESLPFPVGYGVEIATLIDTFERCGLDAMAQVDLGERQNRHQSLHQLSSMAMEVLVAVVRRRYPDDPAIDAASLFRPSRGLLDPEALATEERPPLSEWRAQRS